MSFLKELKRRKVYHVGIAYVMAAWLLLQLTDVLASLLVLPEVVGKVVILVLVIGFPVALFLAWAFELTPEGIKRDGEVDGDRSIAPRSGKKLYSVILVMMGLIIAYLLYGRISGQLPDTVSNPATGIANQTAGNKVLTLGVAVLPFANLSSDTENKFFAAGVHEEVLADLSRIADLRVISRTSMLRIAETDLDVRAIGKRLGVSHVLEGSIRRAGDQVRVTVQLIDAETDDHLWAENYDRTLTDIFAIQTDIALSIAAKLQAELSLTTLTIIKEVPTDNAEAYDLYLKAVQERGIWGGSDTFEAMKPLLERAVALDPNFLRAQVLLAETYGRLLWTGADPDRIYGARSLELVTDIRRRWPDRVEGRLALGHYYYSVERDYTRALAEYQAFEAVFPNDVVVLRSLSSSLKRLGRFEKQLRYARRLVVLDPENSLAASELLYALRFNGLVAETLATAAAGVDKFPEDRDWPRYLARYRLYFLGDVKGYLAFGERLRKADRWAAAGEDLTWLLYGQGDVKTALEHAAERMLGEYGWGEMTAETDRVMILRAQRRDDEAQAAADHALGFVKSWIEARRPFPDTSTRFWYTWAAYCAAIAGDIDAVTQYRASSFEAPADGYLLERLTLLRNARIDALLGDAAAGWARIATGLRMGPSVITAEYAAVLPYYQYLFGEVPAYQEFIAQAKIAD